MSDAASQAALKQTVLYDTHKEQGARFIGFGGWDMPVMYSTIQEEHKATRHGAGLFDLCHMGRLEITGAQRREFIHYVYTNNVHDLEPGRARYGLVLNDKGGAQDDILIYAEEDMIFVVVNASNREKIVSFFNEKASQFDVQIKDVTFDLAMIAIQGPESVTITNKLTDTNVDDIPYYGHTQATLAGCPARIARTGYTGEDGFEFYVASDKAAHVWQELLKEGNGTLLPVGLAARDTLRLEAGMPLYGHEITEETGPLEAGLRFAVKLKKDPEFVGQKALLNLKKEGIKKTLVGLECLDKRVPREGYEIVHNGNVVGEVVSGTASPTLGKNIAQGYIPTELNDDSTELHIRIRGKDFPAKIIKRPFYKRS